MTTLSTHGLTRHFPGVLANDRIDLEIRTGEVHALVGENGAGKTTLASILAGLLVPDEGEVRIDGRKLTRFSPAAALTAGIALVRQHAELVPGFTVAQNLLLPGPWLERLDRAGLEARARPLAEALGRELDLDRQTSSLSVGDRHGIELIRALLARPRFLILDEPSAALAPDEAERLLVVLKGLAAGGLGVLLITHRLGEVAGTARVTVLRRGRVVERLGGDEIAAPDLRARLLKAMFGEARAPTTSRIALGSPGEARLEVRGLSVPRSGGRRGAEVAGLVLRAGEIVGLAGIEGNGQAALFEALAGLRACRAELLALGGQDLRGLGVLARRRLGLAYLSDDRKGEGSLPDLSLAETLLMTRIGERPFWSSLGLFRRETAEDYAERRLAAFDVRASGPRVPAGALSGGNLQKLLLARALDPVPRVVLLNKPTHGLDAATAEAIRRRIGALAAEGAAVLLASPEIDELVELAGRVHVMADGRLLGPVTIEAGREAQAARAIAAFMADARAA